MSQAQDLINVVLDDISPKVVDTILSSNVALQALQNRVVRITGKNKQYPLKYKKMGNSLSFDGFDLLNTNYVDTSVKLTFVPKNIDQPLVFADTDIASAQGDQAIIDLVAFKTEEATQELADALGTMIYSDGTGNSGKDVDGFLAGIKTSGTYGGLSLSTYTTLQATVDSSTNLAGLTLAVLDNMYASVSSGNNVPTHIFTTKAIFAKLKTLLTTSTVAVGNQFVQPNQTGAGSLIPSVRAGLSGNFGYTELYYNGMPIIADEKCPTGHLYMININTWDLLVQAMPASEGYTEMGFNPSIITGQYDLNTEKKFVGFSKSKAVRPPNQLGSVAHIVFRGDLVCSNPKRNGRFSALT